MRMKKVRTLAGRQLFRSIGKLLYFVGLTTLIPFLPVLLVSPLTISALFNKATAVSIFLFCLGGFLIFIGTGSTKKTFRTLSRATLLPAILAFIFSLFGKEFIISLLASFGVAAEFILPWIDKYVPSVLAIAGVYIVISAILFAASFFFRE